MAQGNLEGIVSAFPPLHITSRQLAFAERLGLEPERYACFSLFLSFLLSIPIAGIFSDSIPMFLAAILLSSALLFLLMLRLPRTIFMGRISRMEAELPFSLRMLGMLLELNVPFAESLSIISKGSSPLSEELKAMERDVRRGASIPACLSHLAERLNSIPIRRAILSVSSAYEKGKAGGDLIRISNDLLSMQKHSMKNAASRQSVLSLLFIAVAVILPAFMIIFSSLGSVSPFGNMDPSSIQVMMLVLLPSISALILIFSASMFPPSFFAPRFPLPAFIPAFVAVLVFVLLQYTEIPRIPALVLVLAAAAALSYPSYMKESKREKVEEGLPDVVLSVSSQPPGRGLEPLLASMEKYSMPPLRGELAISLKQAKANVKPEAVLDDLWRRNGSPLLRRFSIFLSHALGAGHDISRYLSMLAEDLLSAIEMRREREALLAMQKYTLISGTLLIPFIIGSSLSLAGGIAGGSPPGIADDSVSYLAIYAFLSAAFISYAEGRPSSFIKYFSLLSLSGIALFHVFSGVPFW